jgi:chromosome segregation ATPase
MATPGNYEATLVKLDNGSYTKLAGPVDFEVVALKEGALDGASYEEINAYRIELEALGSATSAANIVLEEATKQVRAMKKALSSIYDEDKQLDSLVNELRQDLFDIDEKINGLKSKREVGEKNNPTVRQRFRVAYSGMATSYGPTAMHIENLEMANQEFGQIRAELENIRVVRIPELQEKLAEAGAPWTEGQPIPEK